MNSKTTITFSTIAITAVALLFASGPITGNQQAFAYCNSNHWGLAPLLPPPLLLAPLFAPPLPPLLLDTSDTSDATRATDIKNCKPFNPFF